MIEIRDVCYRYDTTNGVGDGLEHINLTIEDGEVVVLCGESGCGKTTITRLMNGLIPHFYDGALTGEVWIDGINVSEEPMSTTSRVVGSVFQNPKSQFFNIDTTSELAFGLESHGVPQEEMLERVQRTAEDMQLQALMNRNIFELSGGEKQQIACGSAYATDPSVYIMDEPSSNLDRKAILRLHDIMKKLKAAGKTLVISEHRLYYLMDLADRFVYVKQGSIERIYTRDEVARMTDDELSALGLRTTDLGRLQSSPEARRILEANRDTFSSAPILEAVDLNCSRGNTRIVEVERMSLPANAIVAVIGDNGSGKSTLCEALCGVLQSNGSVAIGGEFISAKERANRSFMVMQDVNRQLFSESVSEEVLLNIDEADQDPNRVLDELGLLEFKDRHPSSLSGGQKQRVAIASALCAGKDVVFYDEPTSGLDKRGMDRFGAVLRRVRESVDLSVIITHDPELILACCTHVLHVDNGRVQSLYPLDDEGVKRVRHYFLSNEDQSTSRKRETTSPLGKIIKYAGENMKTVYAAAAFMVVGAAASVVPYLLAYGLLKDLLAGQALTLEGCLASIAGVLVAEILYAVLYTHGLALSHRAAFRTLENIRKYLQERMEEKPLGVIQDMGTGAVKKLMTDDVESIELLIAHMMPEGFANIVVPVIALVIMTVVDWQLMLLTLIVVALGVSVSKQMYTIGIDKMGNYFASTKRLNNTIIEYVNGMEVVRVFNRQGESGAQYEKQVFSYRDFALDWYRASWPWMALYGSLFSSITLFSLPCGVLLIMLGMLSVSDYVLVLCLSFGIGPLLMHCMAFISSIPQTNYKIQALEKAMDQIPLKTGGKSFDGASRDIRFEDVHFAYADDEVLKGVSFTAREGQMTALVGPSGSGKSTIARLILHYYDTTGGNIGIGGQNITDLSLESLNRQISYVSQDSFLFNRSLMENIRVGRPDATDEECIQAARKAQCDEFIRQMPQGYDTLAGDSGSRLSGGQRQRISFARAILKDAPIVILDEATAFVDPENEQKMNLAIREIIRGKTVIVIAHKLRSIQNADQILVLDDGRIHSSGTHDELLAHDSLYQLLWEASTATETWTLKEEVAR